MMMNENTRRLIETVNTKNFIEYLNAKNWRLYITPREDVRIYQIYKMNRLYQINIPLIEDLFDYHEEIYKSLMVLTKVEEDSLESIVSRITYFTSNILKIRIENKKNKIGSTGLFDFVNIGEQVKSLVKNTAMSQMQVDGELICLNSDEVNKYLEACEIGQTEVGSYIIPVILPIHNKIQTHTEQIELFPKKSTGYIITNKLISNIETIINTIAKCESEEDISTIFRNEHISSKFCDTLLRMIPDSNSDKTIDITPNWSPLINLENKKTETIKISSNIDKKKLKDVIVMLNSSTEKLETVVGRVTLLKASPILEDRHGGVADISYIDRFGNKKSISATLNDNDYKKAIEAHEEGKIVIIEGKLTIKKRRGYIECNSFERVD